MTVIKERPILFNPEMVRSVLDGRKTQTRRVVKKFPCSCGEWIPDEMCVETPEGWQGIGHSGRWWCECCSDADLAFSCPYGAPGDRLWVRERWRQAYPKASYSDGIVYYADKARSLGMDEYSDRHKWKPSIHMKRIYSRILLKVTDVRVERVQDIAPGDAVAEGIPHVQPGGMFNSDDLEFASLEVANFKRLWDSINEKSGFGWDVNPWVWAVTFKLLEVKG